MKIEVIENDRLFSSFLKFILEFSTILLVEQLFLHANACDRNMLLVTTNIWTIIPHKNWLRRPASGSTANDHSTDSLSNFTLKKRHIFKDSLRTVEYALLFILISVFKSNCEQEII